MRETQYRIKNMRYMFVAIHDGPHFLSQGIAALENNISHDLAVKSPISTVSSLPYSVHEFCQSVMMSEHYILN